MYCESSRSDACFSFLPRGAVLTYRVALWHTDLVSHVITVCVPYNPPSDTYVSMEDIVRNRATHFGYQLQLRSGEVEKAVSMKDQLRQFLNTFYGGRTADGAFGLHVSKGLLFEKFMNVKRSPLLSTEVMNTPFTLPPLFLALADLAKLTFRGPGNRLLHRRIRSTWYPWPT
jgi:hypothetical protein